MPRYRRIAATPRTPDAPVKVEPASETTNDKPQLTDPEAAPEASPAKTRKPRKSTAKKAKE